MSPKKLDQFQVDYFTEFDDISVNCRWLQIQLKQLETLKRVVHRQAERLELLDALNELKQMDCPSYFLDLKV